MRGVVSQVRVPGGNQTYGPQVNSLAHKPLDNQSTLELYVTYNNHQGRENNTYEVLSKLTVIFKFLKYVCSIFKFFFCYVGTRTFEMLTVAFSESTMSWAEVQLWYNRFKQGQEDVNDDARPGRPSTLTTDENIESAKKMILDNRPITIREVADDVGISLA